MKETKENVSASDGVTRRDLIKKSTIGVAVTAGATAAYMARREFLKKSTLAAAAVVASQNIFKTPVYGQTQAPSPGRVIGANDRIVVGYIGVGLQGMAHLTLQKEHAGDNNIAQAAVCDLSKHRQAEAKDAVGGNCVAYEDYRKLLEQKDIDAVPFLHPIPGMPRWELTRRKRANIFTAKSRWPAI